MNVLVVTGSDSPFWQIAEGCVDSLGLAKKALDERISIGFLDDGLDDYQKVDLEKRGFLVRSTVWDPNAPERYKSGFPGSRVKMSKLRLPELFPGFDVYIWVDGDARVLEPSAILELATRAIKSDIVLTTQRNRKYSFKQFHNKWRFSTAHNYFGYLAGLRTVFQKYYNSGVFALRATSPIWTGWRAEWISALSKKDQNVVSDQAALNHFVSKNKLAVTRMDATYNWACHLAEPFWDENAATWRTSRNGQNIKILHFTAKTKGG